VKPISKNSCPSSAPIKGNAWSKIYHKPGQRFYNRTNSEVCFATELMEMPFVPDIARQRSEVS